MRDHARRDRALLGALERRGVRVVADHEADAGLELLAGDGIQDRLQVRASAGDENAEVEGGHAGSLQELHPGCLGGVAGLDATEWPGAFSCPDECPERGFGRAFRHDGDQADP